MAKLLGKRAEAYGFLPKPVVKKKKRSDDDDEDEDNNHTKEMIFKISNSFMINSSYKKGMSEMDGVYW
jgi:hypothetical protein